MTQVSVTIAGRSYRMACEEGEEAHLEALAAAYDAKIAEMRTSFGEIGDMRLHVMAALTFADQIAELRDRVVALEADQARAGETGAQRLAQDDAMRRELAATVTRAAERIERLSARLASKPR
ncbi:cell division protein ZapA [Rhizobiales bacterium GAS191]|nr:cell division protein ZapA [Rhizobiales bacterium GAS188]SED07489.1 cell division protein ZapA [Rhizobiales bacterium GAS191]